MSKDQQPIALGGGEPIALGAPIALGGPTSTTNGTTNASSQNGESKPNGTEGKFCNIIQFSNITIETSTKSSYRFADEVRIGDETIITIPVEHIFYDETNKPKRKSRCGDRPDLQKRTLLF